jgi:hypothetical protein
MHDIDIDAEAVEPSTVIALTERVTLALHEFAAGNERDVVAHRVTADAVPDLLRQLAA